MTSRTVTQYRCDFCAKRGLSASHMTKHELHCTLNPHRICGVCPYITGEVQVVRKMRDLLALLPNHPREYYEAMKDNGELMPTPLNLGAQDEIDSALPALRKACDNCPACIMAALRQASIPVWMATGFDFKKEMKSVWSEVNESKIEACNCGY